MSEGLNELLQFVYDLVFVPTIVAQFLVHLPAWFMIAVGLAVCCAFVAVIFKLISGG